MATYNVDLQDDNGNSYNVMANPDSKAEFEQASKRENINSGESHRTIFGKIRKLITDIGSAAWCSVANNDTTTAAGHVADARVVREHGLEIDQINSNMGGLSFYEDETGNKYVVGADAVPVPLGSPKLIHDGSNDNSGYELIIDCTSLPNHGSLTSDNFLYEVISLASGGYDWGDTSVKIQKTYDPSTGKLTIKTGANNLDTDKAYVHSKGNVYYVV